MKGEIRKKGSAESVKNYEIKYTVTAVGNK